MSKLASKFFSAPTDQSGKEIQFDVREDEEQQKKLQETIELLVAAGYFRARIKGLSAFDKIVGGMTWCITTCNFDVDVDLLFQESSTLGQKITLVERIVSVLPKMKCPHGIEPHQIQGLDFIHIYPVIQWLVKKAIETRAEMGDMNRAFALSQFSKFYNQQLNETELSKLNTVVGKLINLKELNLPQRKYMRKDLEKITDRQSKVKSTLLEYGQQNVLLGSITLNQQEQQSGSKSLESLKQSQEKQTKAISNEENNLQKLMKDMSTADHKQSRVTASAVGQILSLQQSALQQIVNDFTNKENELQQEMEQLEKLANSGDLSMGGLQQKQRYINILKKQIEQKKNSNRDKEKEMDKLKENLESIEQKIKSLKDIENDLNSQMSNLEDFEKNVDQKSVDQLQQLVAIYDELKQKEQAYKKNCKEELVELESELEKLNGASDSSAKSDEDDKYEKINEQHDSAKSKLQTLRLKIAKKNREISTLKRKIDEVPSRIELTQYQKRFIELYNQISAVHTQTKQFYIFYNVLEDKKLYMNKEINLLNSIHDQFNQAMSTPNNREQFIKQLEQIVDGIKNNLSKVEAKKADGKLKCDVLNDKYVNLIENKRVYYKILKDFQEECKKNEQLSKMLDNN